MEFRLEHVDLAFTRTSRFCFVNEIDVRAPASRVFEVVTGELDAWLPQLRGVAWTSVPPHRVGSTRIVELPGVRVKERVVAWDEGRRFAFAIDATSVPLLRRMLEDIQIEPQGERQCRLRYVAHYEPLLVVRPWHPVGRVVFGTMFWRAVRNIARVAER